MGFPLWPVGRTPYVSHAEAFGDGDLDFLKRWFLANCRPKVPITETIEPGQYTVTTQGQFEAYVGKKIPGQLIIDGVIDVHDIDYEHVETGYAYPQLYLTTNAEGSWVHDCRFDGIMSKGSFAIGGEYSDIDNVLFERLSIRRCGFDGIRMLRNSTYRHIYARDFRPWGYDPADGTYVPDGDHEVHAHLDPFQGYRNGNTIEECWSENTQTDSATSCGMFSTDTGEAVTSLIVRRNFFKGSNNYPLHFVQSSASFTGIVLQDNLFDRAYGGYGSHGPVSSGTLGGGALTASGNLWADDRSPISGL